MWASSVSIPCRPSAILAEACESFERQCGHGIDERQSLLLRHHNCIADAGLQAQRLRCGDGGPENQPGPAGRRCHRLDRLPAGSSQSSPACAGMAGYPTRVIEREHVWEYGGVAVWGSPDALRPSRFRRPSVPFEPRSFGGGHACAIPFMPIALVRSRRGTRHRAAGQVQKGHLLSWYRYTAAHPWVDAGATICERARPAKTELAYRPTEHSGIDRDGSLQGHRVQGQNRGSRTNCT